MDAMTALTTRASAPALVEPAPDDAALGRLLEAAVAAPDHGRLRPWRFIAVRGAARARLGEVLAEALKAREPATPEPVLEKERAKPLRAPLILVIAAKLVPQHKVPPVEQLLAAGAAAQNLLVAAHAMGYGSMWKTGAPAYDARVKRALGLDEPDQIVGFLYLGSLAGSLTPAARPAPATFFTEWTRPAA
jgi:nitroreductase